MTRKAVSGHDPGAAHRADGRGGVRAAPAVGLAPPALEADDVPVERGAPFDGVERRFGRV